MENNFELSFH